MERKRIAKMNDYEMKGGIWQERETIDLLGIISKLLQQLKINKLIYETSR